EQIIGIDLAKRVFQVNIVSAQGEKKANKMITREKLTAFIVQQGVVDQIIRLNATAPRLSAALRDFLANRHTQSYDFV
ncbi:hypothetical protein H0S63_22855, partial [Shewanella algae]|nr:hypothetical protein [Shewanella algae]